MSLTNQDAMRIKHFLAKVLDRKNQVLQVEPSDGTAYLLYVYAHSFEQTAIEAIDLLGEIEWPDESCERGDI